MSKNYFRSFIFFLKKYLQNIANNTNISILNKKYIEECLRFELLKLLKADVVVFNSNLLNTGMHIMLYKIEKILCNTLDTKYMFIFISDLNIILDVCANIDKPEKDTRPQVIIIAFTPSIEDKIFIPFVISIIPIKIPLLKGCKLIGNIILPNFSNTPDILKSSEITENSITKPPTIDIVSKLLFTLSPKI